MGKTRIGALLASGALASATILGGAGAANASVDDIIGSVDVFGSLQGENEPIATDDISGGGAEVVASAYDNCTVTFEFVAPLDDDGEFDEDELERVNWVVDYRVGEEEPSIENDEDHLSVYHPVVASNQESVDGLNNHDDHDYDVGLLSHTVNLNDVVEANESGEHDVTFKFYRGTAEWDDEETNLGEVTVTGCDTTDDGGLVGSIVGSVDVFGSLENFS